MFEEGVHLFKSDLESIFKSWDRNTNLNLRQPAVSRNICLAFVNHKDLVSNFNQKEKEQYKKVAIPFLLNHYEKLESAKDKEEVKKLFMFFMKHAVLNIHSIFEKKEEKYIIDIGKESIVELLKFTEKDIAWVLEERAAYLNKVLEEKNITQTKGIKI